MAKNVRNKHIFSFSRQECLVKQGFKILVQFERTFAVPNMDPFIHLLLCFISKAKLSGASVKAFASGMYYK